MSALISTDAEGASAELVQWTVGEPVRGQLGRRHGVPEPYRDRSAVSPPFQGLESKGAQGVILGFRGAPVGVFLSLWTCPPVPSLVFRPLDLETQMRVTALHLRRHLESLARRGLQVEAGTEVLRFLVQVGCVSKLYGHKGHVRLRGSSASIGIAVRSLMMRYLRLSTSLNA